MQKTTALGTALLALLISPTLACGSGGGIVYLLMFIVIYGFPLSLVPAFLLALRSKRADRWIGFAAGVVLAFSVPWLLFDCSRFINSSARHIALTPPTPTSQKPPPAPQPSTSTSRPSAAPPHV